MIIFLLLLSFLFFIKFLDFVVVLECVFFILDIEWRRWRFIGGWVRGEDLVRGEEW